jgi:hypothetical protein
MGSKESIVVPIQYYFFQIANFGANKLSKNSDFFLIFEYL